MRYSIDFAAVPDAQMGAHIRLEEWAAWCNPGRAARRCPMFRDVKPSQQWEAAEPRRTVDTRAAYATEQAVRKLPYHQAMALRWWYVHRGSPATAARRIGVQLVELAEAVDAGRAAVGRELRV